MSLAISTNTNTNTNTNKSGHLKMNCNELFLKDFSNNFNLISVTSDLKKLSDNQLTDHLRQLFNKEKQIGDSILLALKEIKSRRIYAFLGYSSLFEMLVRHFHLSETSSYQRLNALKLMESVPVAAKEIFNGDLSLTNAATLQSFIQRTEREQNKPLSINEKTELIQEVKNKTSKEAQQILAAINPAAVLPKQKEKIITQQVTQLQIVVDAKTLAQLKQVQSLLSHSIPDGDYNQILKYITKEMIVILQKRKGLNVKSEETENHKTDAAELSPLTEELGVKHKNRYIAASSKRIVYTRAQNRCQYVSDSGHRCRGQHQLEIDHIIPISHGGDNQINNLRLLCRSHNQYRTKDTHGYWYRNRK